MEHEGNINALAILMRQVAEKTEMEVKYRLYDAKTPFHHPFGFAHLGKAYEVHIALTEIEGIRQMEGVRCTVYKVNDDGTLTEFVRVNF